MADEPGEITEIIERIEAGSSEARERLAALVYQELRANARRLLSRLSPGHTLQPSDLVHETYFRLRPLMEHPKSRAYFFRAVVIAMKEALADYNQRRRRQRRGGHLQRVAFDEALGQFAVQSRLDLVEFEEALDALASKYKKTGERIREVVLLKIFCGYTDQATADCLGVSKSTVEKDWLRGRAILRSHTGGAKRGRSE